MKNLIVLSVLIFSAAAFAKVKKDDNLQANKYRFSQLSATEALAAGYQTRIFDIHMPGSNTWFKPSDSLCQAGNTVQTVRPFSKCILWESTKDHDTRTFNSSGAADAWGNNVKCVQNSVPMILSSPISYQENVCVLWSGRNDGETKTFTSRMAAKQFDHGDNATCVQMGLVNRTIPTTYTVEFYARFVEIDSKNLLGTHKYQMSLCHAQTLPPVPAN